MVGDSGRALGGALVLNYAPICSSVGRTSLVVEAATLARTLNETIDTVNTKAVPQLDRAAVDKIADLIFGDDDVDAQD